MPKERTRVRSRDSRGRKDRRPRLDKRDRNTREEIREKKSDTRIDSLRQIYGESFARGIRGDAHLSTLLERTGANSLADYLKTAAQSSIEPEDRKGRENGNSSGIRYASEERFREAHRKTTTLHAGLFRRLSE